MRVVIQDTLQNTQRVALEDEGPFVIGSAQHCQVRLDSRFVWPEHVQIAPLGGAWTLTVREGAPDVTVDDVAVRAGSVRRLDEISQISLAQFVVVLDCSKRSDAVERDQYAELHRLQQDLHALTLRRLDLRVFELRDRAPSREQCELVNAAIDDALHGELRARIFADDVMRETLVMMAIRVRLESIIAKERAAPEDGIRAAFLVELPGRNIRMEEQLGRQVGALRARMARWPLDEPPSPELEAAFDRDARRIMQQSAQALVEYAIAQLLKKLMCDLLFGLGPLQDLMDSPGLTEIMVVEPSLVYVERGGRISRSNRTFVSDELLTSVIERIIAPLGRRLDVSEPSVDARLPSARVHAIIPPLAIKGPCLTIRRFGRQASELKTLVERHRSLTPAAAAFLRAAVIGKKNILVAGGTGAGKTTLLNALGRCIPGDERVITIEDAAELSLHHPHVVALEARKPNAEGKGEVSIRELVRNSLRMRPDRVIVGECRGPEAIDMLQAMNTGHAGCLTTLHSNSAEDVTSRLETLVSSGSSIPLMAIRRQIGQAIDLIVYIERHGRRRLITQVTEVIGLDPDTQEVELADVMRIDAGGRLRPTGYMPSFMPELVEAGYLSADEWLDAGNLTTGVLS